MSRPLFRQCQPPEFDLFDCHVHIGPSDTGQLFYPELTAGEYIGLMDASGIAGACIFAPMRDDGYGDANRRLATEAADSGGRLRAFARLGGSNMPVPEARGWLVRRKLRSLVQPRGSDVDDLDELADFSGVKMQPHMDGVVSDAELARISELRLPVLVHGGHLSEPRWIAETIARRIDGPVIIAHLGVFPCAENLLAEAVTVARRYPNIYLDTSGAWHAEYIRYAVQHVPDKILFGSDAPLMHPGVAWQHVTRAIHDDRILERIGRGAAAEIMGDFSE